MAHFGTSWFQSSTPHGLSLAQGQSHQEQFIFWYHMPRSMSYHFRNELTQTLRSWNRVELLDKAIRQIAFLGFYRRTKGHQYYIGVQPKPIEAYVQRLSLARVDPIVTGAKFSLGNSRTLQPAAIQDPKQYQILGLDHNRTLGKLSITRLILSGTRTTASSYAPSASHQLILFF